MSAAQDRLAAALADRYSIERALGAGGMATVYLARDLKHERDVAIKVLKPELAAVLGAERFVAEIKTTAQLQHPNILPLFDSGEAEGFLYYVMPYVEGESLRDKLDREKQLGIDEAVKITTEVADALDYAHEDGVVHRDIKPENILLHAGRPMVADFGIALAVSAAAGGRMTETGLSLGTPHYMSPEQATAEKDITGRSDVYSLASVLYEMLAGDPPHTGKTAQQIIAKIIAEDPAPVDRLRRSVPANVAAAVSKALEKLPADRFESAKAFAEALADPGFRHGAAEAAGTGAAGTGRSAVWKQRAFLPLAVVACVSLGAAVWGWLRAGPVPPPVSRQAIVLGPTLLGMIAGGAAVAPDGSAIVFTDTLGGSRKLWIKERGQLDARPLADLTRLAGGGGSGPSFSPDGRWIIYADRALMRVARSGGAPIVVSDSTGRNGGTWLDDGTIVFIQGHGEGLFRTSAAGGPTTPVRTDSLGGLINHVAPVPGADAVLLNVGGGRGGLKEVALDVATGAVHTLVRGATAAWVVPGGDLVYARSDGGLYAAPFDRGKLALAGPSVSVLDGVQTVGGLSDVVLGRDGTMLYVGGATSMAGAELVSVSRDGSGVGRVDSTWSGAVAGDGGLALSPDGSRLALSVVDSTTGREDLVVLHLPDGPATRLTFQGSLNIRPGWSPDGRKILFVSADSGASRADLRVRNADGSGRPVRVAAAEKRPIVEGQWSPDGKWIVYRTSDAKVGNGDILAVRTSGDSTPAPLAATDAEEEAPALSPDGRWLAYTSSTSGRFEIYVRPFPNAQDGLWQVSGDGGTEPEWSHDGKELFYRNGAGEMIAVDVTTGPTFASGAHHRLFNASGYAANYQSHFYALTPDDHRFLFVHPVASTAANASAPRLVLVRNWLPWVRAKLKGQRGS